MSGHRKLVVFIICIALMVANFCAPLRIKRLAIELLPEAIVQVGGFAVTNTLLSSWLAMLILALVAILGSRKLVDKPSALSLQNILESAVEALLSFMQNFAGAMATTFFPVVGTLFFYILVSNWIGLLPGFGSIGIWSTGEGERVFTPLLRGSTTDLNTTLALALCGVISLQVYGARALGLGAYVKRFIAIDKLVAFARSIAKGDVADTRLLVGGLLDVFVGILEILEELTKILSFSFRLFGNMFGGEVLLTVMAFLVPYMASIPFFLLEMFGGFIQALIFATLTTAFLSRATARHDVVPEMDEGSASLEPASA